MQNENSLQNTTEVRENVKQYAKENFRSGLNCAESVFLALQKAGLIKLPAETVALTTGFGGGMGLTGGVCGALVAAIMGIGSVHGRSNPAEGTMDEIVDKLYGNPGLYRFFNQIPNKFVEIYGSTQCSELNKEFEKWTDKNRMRNCMNIVVETSGMAVDYIFQGDEGFVKPFGPNVAGKNN